MNFSKLIPAELSARTQPPPPPPSPELSDEDGIDEIPDILPPDELIVFENPEKRPKQRAGPDEFMPYRDARVMLSAMPGSGKRSMILNIVFRIWPRPRAIHVVHSDPDTIEYNELHKLSNERRAVPVNVYSPADFPDLDAIANPVNGPPLRRKRIHDVTDGAAGDEDEPEFDPDIGPSVVIIDECPKSLLGKTGAERMERLINQGATHLDTIVLCSLQSMVNVPLDARRGFNHFALWKHADKFVNKWAADKIGISGDTLADLFEFCESKYDCIWIDAESPDWRFRRNFIEQITFVPKV